MNTQRFRTTTVIRHAPGMMRRAFTLIEMLVVIIVLLVLVGAVVPVALRLTQGDRVRDAADTVQIALATARDRAMAEGSPVGIRLIPDDADPSLVSALAFIRKGEPITGDSTYGRSSALVMHGPGETYNFQTNNWVFTRDAMTRCEEWPEPLTDLDSAIFGTVVLIGGDIQKLTSRLVRTRLAGRDVIVGAIRLEHAGPLRPFWTTDAEINRVPDNPKLFLFQPLAMPVPWATTAIDPRTDPIYNQTAFDLLTYGRFGDDYKIFVGNERIEDSDPIRLPTGTVIDLGHLDQDDPVDWIDQDGDRSVDPPSIRLSRVPRDEAQNWDILISPSGQVTGSAASEPHIVLWVRETLAAVNTVDVSTSGPPRYRKLINATGTGRHVLVTMFSRTGFVHTTDANFLTSRDPIALPMLVNIGGATYYNPANYYDNIPQGAGTGL